MIDLNKYVSKELEYPEEPITVKEFLSRQEIDDPNEFHIIFDNGRITPDKYGLYTILEVPEYYNDKIVKKYFIGTFGVNIYVDEDVI